jgi:hypothetical protein
VVCADVDKSGSVAIGLSDTDDFATITGRDSLNINLASAGAAGAARTVDLAVVLSVEVDDLDRVLVYGSVERSGIRVYSR